jgi:hypothetical protein
LICCGLFIDRLLVRIQKRQDTSKKAARFLFSTCAGIVFVLAASGIS